MPTLHLTKTSVQCSSSTTLTAITPPICPACTVQKCRTPTSESAPPKYCSVSGQPYKCKHVTLCCSFTNHDGRQGGLEEGGGQWGPRLVSFFCTFVVRSYSTFLQIVKNLFSGYYMWDGLSGVPGLGNHIRNAHNSENIYKEWSEIMSPKLKHQSISPSCSKHLHTHLVLPQHGCSKTFYDSYSSTCDSLASSSTNSCDEKSWHEIRSLHNLPSFSNRFF